MKPYEKNSPEAIARILTMMMISDAKLDDNEIDVLDRLRVFDIIGISRAGFSQVVQDYCSELMNQGGPDDRIRLVDKARIDEVIGLVDDPSRRVETCSMILNIANADGALHDAELALLKYILERWGMSLESLEQELTGQR
jgi:uncharacterized tellurite resistance protein B-like protein